MRKKFFCQWKLNLSQAIYAYSRTKTSRICLLFNMTIKNISFLLIAAILGFIALLNIENDINEKWMVHCLTCIG